MDKKGLPELVYVFVEDRFADGTVVLGLVGDVAEIDEQYDAQTVGVYQRVGTKTLRVAKELL